MGNRNIIQNIHGIQAFLHKWKILKLSISIDDNLSFMHCTRYLETSLYIVISMLGILDGNVARINSLFLGNPPIVSPLTHLGRILMRTTPN